MKDTEHRRARLLQFSAHDRRKDVMLAEVAKKNLADYLQRFRPLPGMRLVSPQEVRASIAGIVVDAGEITRCIPSNKES